MLAGRGRAHFFGTTSKLIRELAYRGKRLNDRRVHHPFPDTCLTTESGPSFTFKTRHLGDSESIVSRIPRLWSVKTAWIWAQQRGTEQIGRYCAFRPPRGSKCSSHGSRGHQPSHIQRHPCEEIHPCYPTTIGVSGNLS
jgi:hypothetical protein